MAWFERSFGDFEGIYHWKIEPRKCFVHRTTDRDDIDMRQLEHGSMENWLDQSEPISVMWQTKFGKRERDPDPAFESSDVYTSV
jgi:hypothetical protein